MDYDDAALRDSVAELDEQHHEGMRTFGSDIRELHAVTRPFRGTSRRQFLARTGFATAAVTIGSQLIPFPRLLSPAFAAEGGTLTDADIAAFAASVEYAAVEAYKAAAATNKVTGDALKAAQTFLGHHQAHGDAFFSAAQGKATKNPNKTLVASLGPAITKAADQKAILALAYDVENTAAATYQFALGALKSVEALKLTASILPIEAGHAVTLGTVLGYKASEKTDYLPKAQSEDGKLDPAKTPA